MADRYLTSPWRLSVLVCLLLSFFVESFQDTEHASLTALFQAAQSELAELRQQSDDEAKKGKEISKTRVADPKEEMAYLRNEILAWRLLGDVIKSQAAGINGQLAEQNADLAKSILTETDKREKALENGEEVPETTERVESARDVMKSKNIFLNLKSEVVVAAENMSDFLSTGPNGVDVENACSDVKKSQPTETLYWEPTEGRYLIALCLSGSVSDRIRCIQMYLILSALLNRTLIIPSDGPPIHTKYGMNLMVDIGHTRKCAGERSVVTEETYMERAGNGENKGKILCLWSNIRNSTCGLKNEFEKMGIHIPNLKLDYTHISRIDSESMTKNKFLEDFGQLSDPLISFGDLHYFNFQKMDFVQMDPIKIIKNVKRSCQLFIKGAHFFWREADLVVQNVLGTKYLGLSIRRLPSENFCLEKKKECFTALDQLATCVANNVNSLRTEISTIYFSHNGGKQEIHYFLNALHAQLNRKFVFLTVHDFLTFEWRKKLRARKWDRKPEAPSILDTILLSTSQKFLGISGSSESLEVFRMREGLGTRNCFDKEIC